MKRYGPFIIFLCCILIPKITLAKLYSCNETSLEIEKDVISIGEASLINIKSPYKYNVAYRTSEDGYIIISDGFIRGEKGGRIDLYATINFLNAPDDINKCELTIPITIQDNDATLKELNVTEYDISSRFKSNIYSYEFKVPYNIDKINIIATPTNEKANVTGAGETYLNQGENIFNVVVMAENGTKRTYTLTILRESPNNDPTLKNLIIEGFVLTPKFNKNTYNYTLEVDNIDRITIKATSNNENTTIKGLGTFELNTGKNTYYIYGVAEDGSELKYELNVIKKNGSSSLNNLAIKGFNLDSEFKSEKYDYYISTEKNIKSLDINAAGTSDDDTIEIVGNENLKYGINNIYIRVTNKDKTTTTYKIVLEKIKMDNPKNNVLLIILFIMFILAIIFMISIIGIFINNNFRKKYNKVIKRRIKKGDK